MQELIGSNPVGVWKRARGRRRRSAGARIDEKQLLDFAELDCSFLSVAQADWPDYYPFILFMADTGARIGEPSALRWIEVDLDEGTAHISRSFSDGKAIGPTKTGKARTVELSSRLQGVITRSCGLAV